MRGLKQDRSARMIVAGHGFVQNVRRGHYALAVEEPLTRRLAVAFNELAVAIPATLPPPWPACAFSELNERG